MLVRFSKVLQFPLFGFSRLQYSCYRCTWYTMGHRHDRKNLKFACLFDLNLNKYQKVPREGTTNEVLTAAMWIPGDRNISDR